jgi:deazaflavin-dependent oxidoreductase (nitroreductase family)
MNEPVKNEQVKNTQENSYKGPPPAWLLRFLTKLNVFVYKLSGGKLMAKLAGLPILLVEMTGAKSGARRTIPLMYVPHGDKFLLVASQGGAARNPVWYNNLIAYPDVKITFGGETKTMKARQLDDEEKQDVWPVCCEYYPPYQDYQTYTDRNIPVFICE